MLRALAMLFLPLLVALPLMEPALVAPPVVAAGQIMSVTPTSREGEYRVEAEGFRDDEPVSVRLLGPGERQIKLDRDKANRRGRVRVTVFIPRYEPGGLWTVRLTGIDSDKVKKEIFMVPPRRPNAGLVVTPSDGTAETAFTLEATGFAPLESVTAWLTRPDGAGVTLYALQADATGRVTFVTLTRLDGPAGDWFAAAYGQASDRLGAATFRVSG